MVMPRPQDAASLGNRGRGQLARDANRSRPTSSPARASIA